MTTTARITRWGQPEVSERVVFRETPAWLEGHQPRGGGPRPEPV